MHGRHYMSMVPRVYFDTMDRIMRTYFARWQFKHPRTRDFIAVACEVSGQDLGWFFDQHIAAVTPGRGSCRYGSLQQSEPDRAARPCAGAVW